MAQQSFLVRKTDPEDGEPYDTVLVIDDEDQVVVLVQDNDDGEDRDVVLIPLEAFDTICNIIVQNLDEDGKLKIVETMSVN